MNIANARPLAGATLHSTWISFCLSLWVVTSVIPGRAAGQCSPPETGGVDSAAAAVEMDSELEAALKEVKGWQKNWREFVNSFDEVRVEVFNRKSMPAGSMEMKQLFLKRGVATRLEILESKGTGEIGGVTPQVWITDESLVWHRIGNGDWVNWPKPAPGLPDNRDVIWRINNEWMAVPQGIEEPSEGRKRIIFRLVRGGRLEWDYSTDNKCIVRMAEYSEQEELRWEEERTSEADGECAVLKERRRREYLPDSIEVVETLDWSIGPGSVDQRQLVPLPVTIARWGPTGLQRGAVER